MEWTTKDGRKIEIAEMTDTHLDNTVNMLKRNGFVHSDTALSCLAYSFSSSSGSMAAMAAENEFVNMKFHSVTDAIFDEHSRRLK